MNKLLLNSIALSGVHAQEHLGRFASFEEADRYVIARSVVEPEETLGKRLVLEYQLGNQTFEALVISGTRGAAWLRVLHTPEDGGDTEVELKSHHQLVTGDWDRVFEIMNQHFPLFKEHHALWLVRLMLSPAQLVTTVNELDRAVEPANVAWRLKQQCHSLPAEQYALLERLDRYAQLTEVYLARGQQ